MTLGAADALTARFGSGATVVVTRAPGRVNLIGEHTDYNDGFVLPLAIDRFVEAAVRPRTDRQVRLFATDLDQVVEFVLGAPLEPAWPGWAPYLYGLTEELRKRTGLTTGFDLAVRGNVPRGAGLSSSAALLVASLLALDRSFSWGLDGIESAILCRDVEHRWAGVRCGVMDPLVSRLGRNGHALLLDCRELQYRHVPLRLGEHRLVLVDSAVRRELTNSAYNERREECRRGVQLLAEVDPEIRSLRDVDRDRLSALEHALPPPLALRCRHVIEENARVLDTVDCLNRSDLCGVGKLLTASHASLRDLFEVSHPVLDRLVEASLAQEGVLGARLTGAGFGGCILVLCRDSAVDPLRNQVGEERILLTVPAVEAGDVEPPD